MIPHLGRAAKEVHGDRIGTLTQLLRDFEGYILAIVLPTPGEKFHLVDEDVNHAGPACLGSAPNVVVYSFCWRVDSNTSQAENSLAVCHETGRLQFTTVLVDLRKSLNVRLGQIERPVEAAIPLALAQRSWVGGEGVKVLIERGLLRAGRSVSDKSIDRTTQMGLMQSVPQRMRSWV